jgi:hypothetical protein
MKPVVASFAKVFIFLFQQRIPSVMQLKSAGYLADNRE